MSCFSNIFIVCGVDWGWSGQLEGTPNRSTVNKARSTCTIWASVHFFILFGEQLSGWATVLHPNIWHMNVYMNSRNITIHELFMGHLHHVHWNVPEQFLNSVPWKVHELFMNRTISCSRTIHEFCAWTVHARFLNSSWSFHQGRKLLMDNRKLML